MVKIVKEFAKTTTVLFQGLIAVITAFIVR